MTTNSQLSTTEPKNKKLSKQLEQEQNHRNADHMEGCQLGGGVGRMGGKVQGIRSIVFGIKNKLVRRLWVIVKLIKIGGG